MSRVRMVLVMGALTLAVAPPARSGPPRLAPLSRPESPNLVAHVSAAILDAAVRRPVNRLEQVQEMVLDTPVFGLSRTCGTVRSELIPDPARVVLDVVHTGLSRSQTVGRQPLVRIYTFTAAPFETRERVVIDATGVRAFPAPGFASAKITLLGITNRHGETDTLAPTFARFAFRQDKEEAEREVSLRTAQKLTEQLDREMVPAVARVYRLLDEGLARIKRAGLTREEMRFNTTAERVEALLRITTPGLRGPAAAPPKPSAVDLDLSIHQSLVNEAARLALGGKTYPLPKVRERLEALTDRFLRDDQVETERRAALKAVEKLLADLGGKPPTITLAKKSPLVVAFNAPGFTVEVHVAETRWAGKSYAGVRVRADYRLKKTREGPLTVRRGPLQFLPLERSTEVGKKHEPASATLRLVQEAFFNQIVKERLVLADLPLPARLSRLGPLTVRARTSNSWLLLEWQRQQQAKRQSSATVRP